PVGMVLLEVALHSLGTEHPAVERELVPRLHAHDDVVLDLELQAALLTAEAAVRLDISVRLHTGIDAQVGGVRAGRTELANGLELERRGEGGARSVERIDGLA